MGQFSRNMVGNDPRAQYGWIIDRDYLYEQDPTVAGWGSSVGQAGPRNIDPKLLERLKSDPDFGTKFRLYDDDRELYYEGRCATTSGDLPHECDDEIAFGPLTDYGAPDSGCTEICYRQKDGTWGDML